MPASHRPGKTSFPDQRTLLTWLFGGRLVIALATLIAGALVWTSLPQLSFIASVAVILALVITGYGAWQLRHPAWQPGPTFLAAQFIVDLIGASAPMDYGSAVMADAINAYRTPWTEGWPTWT